MYNIEYAIFSQDDVFLTFCAAAIVPQEIIEAQPDLSGLNLLPLDSYMLDADELQLGAFRVLRSRYISRIPADAEIRLAVTGTDVIHRFCSILALGKD